MTSKYATTVGIDEEHEELLCEIKEEVKKYTGYTVSNSEIVRKAIRDHYAAVVPNGGRTGKSGEGDDAG